MGNTGPGGDEEGGSVTLKAGSAGERVVVEVDDEFPERFRNAESWEETISWRVESPRGTICRVVTAGDIESYLFIVVLLVVYFIYKMLGGKKKPTLKLASASKMGWWSWTRVDASKWWWWR